MWSRNQIKVNLPKFDLIYYWDYLEIIVNEFQYAEFFLDSLLIVRNFIQKQSYLQWLIIHHWKFS